MLMLVLDRSAGCLFAIGRPSEVSFEGENLSGVRAYSHLLLFALCLDVRDLLFDTVAVMN